MSVLSKDLNSAKFRAFIKGSPEKIKELSIPESVPENFDECLEIYT